MCCWREDSGARKHVDGAIAANRGGEHVVGGCVVKIERAGPASKRHACAIESAGRNRRAAGSRPDDALCGAAGRGGHGCIRRRSVDGGSGRGVRNAGRPLAREQHLPWWDIGCSGNH